MNRSAFLIHLGISLILANVSFSQISVSIDTSFGNGGKVEMNIGVVTNDVITLDAARGTPITVGLKLGTTKSGNYRIGIIRLDTNGHPDLKFGMQGTGVTDIDWGGNDEPFDMRVQWDIDSTLIVCGVTGTSNNFLPAMYHFKKNGIPDSSFGTNGRLLLSFDGTSSGEADNIFSAYPGYVLCGKNYGNQTSSKPGFGVIYLTKEAKPDTNYGVSRLVIPALVHSVHGFNLNDRHIFLCGISDTGKREILIASITYQRAIDTSISKTGLIHTGIFLSSGDTIMARMRTTDDKIMILLPSPDSSPKPIILCRFNGNGTLDSSYGNNGIGRSYLPPNSGIDGMNPSNDNSTFVSGSTLSGAPFGMSITARLNDTTALPDPKYFPDGIAMIDVDGGVYDNYLNLMLPVGKVNSAGNSKRYIGAGNSIHNDLYYVMVTRLVTAPTDDVNERNIPDNILDIYPNPASSEFKIETSLPQASIRIIDALGREVFQPTMTGYDGINTISSNVSALPNGIYFCIAQCSGQQIIRKMIIAH